MRHIHGQAAVQEHVVRRLQSELYKDLDFEQDGDIHQAVSDLMTKLDKEFLYHIGVGPGYRNAKLRFLGFMIHRMFLVNLGILPETDRDSYVTKRFHSPGVSLSKAFKTHFNSTIVTYIKKQFIRVFKSVPFKQVNLKQSYLTAFSGNEFLRAMSQAITTGAKTSIKVNARQRTINRTSTQLIDRKNQLKVISTIRKLESPNNDNSKNSARAHRMRMPHASMHGYGCFIQSPEGGEKVGLHKQACITGSITTYGSSEFLKGVLRDDKKLIKVDDFDLYDMPKMRRVFVNGDWLGCVEDSIDLVHRYTHKRRYNEINYKTVIEWCPYINEVYFWVDYGCVIRPLMIVYNNVRDWKELGMKAPLKPDD
jgi:DNA-directed RNA polymerase beta subunit